LKGTVVVNASLANLTTSFTFSEGGERQQITI
jgi:hypothetical protein